MDDTDDLRSEDNSIDVGKIRAIQMMRQNNILKDVQSIKKIERKLSEITAQIV